MKLSKWTDCTFLQWKEKAGEVGGDVGNLRYVFQGTITNKDAHAILDIALDKCKKELVTSKDALTFSFDDPGCEGQAAKALLGTPNGGGVTWLLINHKSADQFGLKTEECNHLGG